MFPALQLEILDRFSALEAHFRSSKLLEGGVSQTARGLVFIQLYAVHEYLIQTGFRIAITQIASHGHRFSELKPSLLTVFLDSSFQSVQDCASKRAWETRLQLVGRASSRGQITVPESAFPTDGTHFRHPNLLLIFDVLGIERKLTVRRRHLFMIDEVVNHRNAIAHGSETAASIGRRYSRSDMWKRIRVMRKAALRWILLLSEHCNEPQRHLK